jgi:hypothetical protein
MSPWTIQTQNPERKSEFSWRAPNQAVERKRDCFDKHTNPYAHLMHVLGQADGKHALLSATQLFKTYSFGERAA